MKNITIIIEQDGAVRLTDVAEKDLECWKKDGWQEDHIGEFIFVKEIDIETIGGCEWHLLENKFGTQFLMANHRQFRLYHHVDGRFHSVMEAYWTLDK